ncbi:MAG: KH domain-containing protein [Methanomassiliicoccales archaeon]|nr:KH domain-containing protein [Methanomassiliicoccales archaeon]
MRIIRIPKDRVGALIGKEGETKKFIEERSKVALYIDSEGEVTLDESAAEDPVMGMKVGDIVKAIGRGFSPHRAFRLFDDDEYLDTIDIRDYVGKKTNNVVRMRARIIGSNGKTRRIIEELTGASISIYGSTVSIVANDLQLPIARTAIDMLLRGSEHATVYRYLERCRPQLRMGEMGFA